VGKMSFLKCLLPRPDHCSESGNGRGVFFTMATALILLAVPMPTWRVEAMIGSHSLARDRILDPIETLRPHVRFGKWLPASADLGRIGINPNAYLRSNWSRGKNYDCIVLGGRYRSLEAYEV
jgi:hypothetical protein